MPVACARNMTESNANQCCGKCVRADSEVDVAQASIVHLGGAGSSSPTNDEVWLCGMRAVKNAHTSFIV